jgi:hypothetical protein
MAVSELVCFKIVDKVLALAKHMTRKWKYNTLRTLRVVLN